MKDDRYELEMPIFVRAFCREKDVTKKDVTKKRSDILVRKSMKEIKKDRKKERKSKKQSKTRRVAFVIAFQDQSILPSLRIVTMNGIDRQNLGFV